MNHDTSKWAIDFGPDIREQDELVCPACKGSGNGDFNEIGVLGECPRCEGEGWV